MASDVDLCNMALSHVGSDTIVTSISPPDGSVESGHCARFYPIARAELIESHNWSFALRRITLAAVTNPSQAWAYAYALPSPCLKPVKVLQSFLLQQFGLFFPSGWVTPDELRIFDERGCADFTIEDSAADGQILLTNEPEAVLLYLIDVIDTAKFTPSFRTSLSYLLASFLAGPIIKGSEGAETGGKLRKIAGQVAGGARELNANSGAEPANQVPDSIRARL